MVDFVDFGAKQCIVLDVGANRGGFASNILLRAPLAQIHCFEPNSELADELQVKAKKFGSMNGMPRCVVNPVGVGSSQEERELNVTGLHAAASFLHVADAARNGWPSADFETVRRDVVRVIRLDNYLDSQRIEAVKLLKLDVQGYELEALRGCGDRLRDIEYIVCEVQFQRLYEGAPLWHEIIGYARKFGFEPVVMDGFCFAPDGSPLQADVLLRSRF